MKDNGKDRWREKYYHKFVVKLWGAHMKLSDAGAHEHLLTHCAKRVDGKIVRTSDARITSAGYRLYVNRCRAYMKQAGVSTIDPKPADVREAEQAEAETRAAVEEYKF